MVNNIRNKDLNKISKAIKKNPSIKELEKGLTKTIGLKVRINAKDNDKGKVSIEYRTTSELNAILEMLEKK